MSLKVSHVRGMPFVKVPMHCQFTLPKCACKIFSGQFGKSLGVFVNESSPSAREKVEEMELLIKSVAKKYQSRVEVLLEEEFEDKVKDLKLIKNGILWGKVDSFSKSHSKITASVVFRINHIFFSTQRVSISCNVLDMYKPASAT